MELSEGCASALAVYVIVLVVALFLVVPIWVFAIDVKGIGWGFPLVAVGVFFYFVAMFLEFEDNKLFNIVYYVFISVALMVLIRDFFVRDVRAALDLVLSVPVGLLVYFLLYVPLANGMRQTGQLFVLKILGLIGNVILNVLILFILRYFLPA